MPQLKILALCDRVIVDFNHKTPSLIGIFQRVNAQIPDAPLPERAVAPMRWAVFTLWVHTEEERNIEYTQHTRINDATGGVFAEATTKFTVTEPDDFQSKNTIEIFGMPISVEGRLSVTVWLDGIDDSKADYPFFVKHVRSESNDQTAASKVIN
jgi:hypothetical protein